MVVFLLFLILCALLFGAGPVVGAIGTVLGFIGLFIAITVGIVVIEAFWFTILKIVGGLVALVAVAFIALLLIDRKPKASVQVATGLPPEPPPRELEFSERVALLNEDTALRRELESLERSVGITDRVLAIRKRRQEITARLNA
ncbi:hypothetical protein TSH58p_07180 [Azospirillum sp. TSH58]|uniref:hypothetical protein n=1 Tax=Azospirillum sp. TSH58 TaxID=664962 RepID=UPI000D5FFAC6|nr:hypothetical protein [Azospirillum sp. TSH58]AWJ83328.1 hypothetical protein TSH58p_07180 [Azospirillum sp. TSH58]PWC73079.1 hypothetical protein TSH58_05130 [Azospirillum sp. TSH58]